MAICTIIDGHLKIEDIQEEKLLPGNITGIAIPVNACVTVIANASIFAEADIPPSGVDKLISEFEGSASSVICTPDEKVLLSPDNTVGLMAAIAKNIDQEPSGVGRYGISVKNLQLIGVVKPGILLPPSTEDALIDPSVFTGKKGVVKLIDLFVNEALQRELAEEAINANMTKLSEIGVITGDESPERIAEIGSLTTVYSTEEIQKYINDPGSLDFSLLEKMLAFGSLAIIAIQLLSIKLPSISFKKFSLPSFNTIKLPSMDAAIDNAVGSTKVIPAAVAAAESAKKATGD